MSVRRKESSARNCWYRFDEDYAPPEKNAAMASYDGGGDPHWYVDSGAANHVTGELAKLTARDKYSSNDQTHTASGACYYSFSRS